MRTLIPAFVCGALFAVGLILSGMTQPGKVIGFLDVFGGWDPTLAFVMAGAIAAHAPTRRWVNRRAAPLLDTRFHTPAERPVDGRLMGGAAIFGVGWGLAGFCPGPAIVSIGSESVNAIPFAMAMLVGVTVFKAIQTKRTP